MEEFKGRLALMRKIDTMVRMYLKILRKESLQDRKALALMVAFHDSVCARNPDVARLMAEVEELIERAQKYVV